MHKKLNIGVLGCANIAQKYAIQAFQSIDGVGLIRIASRDYEKAKDWASRFGIQAEKSYDSLIASDIDAVYIPLPIGLHKEWAVRAARSGKHIICEKSLAENFRSAKEIVEICRSHRVVLYENFMCDKHPQHEKVLELIESGVIGKPFIFQGYFGFPPFPAENFRYSDALGGGSLNDAGAYTVFMARKILRKEPLSVTCRLVRDKDKNVDIQGTAMLEFDNNVAALIGFSFDAVYQNNYSLWGNAGLIRVHGAYSIPLETKPFVELVKNENLKEIVQNIDVPAANQFELLFRDFCDMVLNKENRADKINDVYARIIAQAKTMEAMRISAKENRKAQLAEIS